MEISMYVNNKKNYEKKMKKSGSRIDKREGNNKNKREE
jgi:hypothetical protein